jgi:nucleotide sugar dehydrogenase
MNTTSLSEITQDKLIIIGQGYVGLPIAMRAVDTGFNVVGLDLDQIRVGSLRAARSYVEDVPNRRVREALDSGRYWPSSDYADAEGFNFAIITVPTPLKDTLPDLSFVVSAAEALAPHLRSGAIVVLESTTYPGTTEGVVAPVLEQQSGLVAGRDFALGYSPERIDPGNPRWNFVNTPKIVSGVNNASLEVIRAFYTRLVETTVPVSSPKEAELSKLLENIFRHVNIALVNEIAILGKRLGVDVWEAIEAAGTKPFGFMRFTPGPGVGGHCLPVDPSYLSWQIRTQLGRNFRFVELANDVNDHMPNYVVERVAEGLNRHGRPVNGSYIILLGLAYKANTGDIRESPAVRIAELLGEMGAAVEVVDSHVERHRCPPGLKLTELSASNVEQADAVVLLTGHDDVDYSLIANARWVLDTRNQLPGSHVERL